MTTTEKVKLAYNNAVKTKDTAQRDVLKLVKAAIANEEIAQKRDLTESETINLLKKQVKSRHENAEKFYKGVDQVRYQQELYEANVINDFLPKDMPEEEVKQLLLRIAFDSNLQITHKANMGQLVKLTVAASEGRTDGKVVSSLINKINNGSGT